MTPVLESASRMVWDSSAIVAHAKVFEKEAFIGRLQEVAREVLLTGQDKPPTESQQVDFSIA
jgi:hypothetical protein